MTTFTWRVTYGAQVTFKPKTHSAPYGDGYTARIAQGINNNPGSWAVTVEARDDAEATAIMTFLATANGVASFTWTNLDGVAGLYICTSYSRGYDDEDKNNIHATFDQVFGE